MSVTTDDALRSAAAQAREKANAAAATVRDLRRILGNAMAAEREANRVAREAEGLAARS